MNIPIHAVVHCTDGDFGHTTCLVINPVNNQITHFVANDRRTWGREYLIPVAFIISTTENGITVNCDRNTLTHQPDFHEYEYDRLDSEIPYREEHIYLPVMLPGEPEWFTDTYAVLEHEQIPADELAIRRGMAVYTKVPRDADPVAAGHVEAFVADPKTGNITHMILRKGHLWGQRDITIPVNQIHRIEENGVHLKLTEAEVGELPEMKTHRQAVPQH